MTPAQRLTNQVREAVSKTGTRLFNVHVGKFWAGAPIRFNKTKTVEVHDGDVLIRRARLINSGIEGMADLVGFTPVVVTPEMVGSTVAVYSSVEIKTTDRPSPAQVRWMEFINENGGRAGIARTPEEAVKICGVNQKGMSSDRS